jgi:hypothetical protein
MLGGSRSHDVYILPWLTALNRAALLACPRVGANLFSWKDSHPHLAGLIAGLGAWALQLTSIHYIRRRWFDVSPVLPSLRVASDA